MTGPTKETILVWVGILSGAAIIWDFISDRLGYIRKLYRWSSGLIASADDHEFIRLDIPKRPLLPDPPPQGATKPPVPEAPPVFTDMEGVQKVLVCYIMGGHDKLLAYQTTRDGIPGTRFLVVRERAKQDPASKETSSRAEANDQWREWYLEWKKRPGGFGGTFGTGLSGEPPF